MFEVVSARTLIFFFHEIADLKHMLLPQIPCSWKWQYDVSCWKRCGSFLCLPGRRLDLSTSGKQFLPLGQTFTSQIITHLKTLCNSTIITIVVTCSQNVNVCAYTISSIFFLVLQEKNTVNVYILVANIFFKDQLYFCLCGILLIIGDKNYA